MASQLIYGNWIRRRVLYVLGISTAGVGALYFIPLGTVYHAVIFILFLLMALTFLIPLYTYFMFSQSGRRFQEKIYEQIILSLGKSVNGRILDIGSGNGVLAVKLAMAHPEIQVTGMDYWGKDWEYSKSVCEKNAQIAGVSSRVQYQKGDAAKLDFPSATFDGAVSNLTFHEVRSAADKREVVCEALRVVKPGGVFAFIDYFSEEKYYGQIAGFEDYLKSLNLAQFEYHPLRDVMDIPFILRLPIALGRVGILRGRK